MPRTATDYSNTIIYKIQSIDNPELLYVGSTTDFTKRKYNHKNTCNKPNHKCYNLKLYKMIRDNGGWDMFNMVIIKEFPCEDKRQAECEEDRCIREMKADLNMRRAFITPDEILEYNKQYREQNKEQMKQYYEQNKEQYKQYYEQNKEQIAEQRKQYREQNKEQIAEKNKQYREQNKEQIAEYKKQYYEQNKDKINQYREQNKEQNKEYHKQYREQNKEQIAERNKQYREQNKEQIAEKNKQYGKQNKEQIAERKKQYGKQKITCDCGCIIRRDSMIRHKRTKNHQDLMKSIEQ